MARKLARPENNLIGSPLAEVFARGTPLTLLPGPVPGGPEADGGGVGRASCCHGSVHAADRGGGRNGKSHTPQAGDRQCPYSRPSPSRPRNRLPANIYHLFDSTKLRLRHPTPQTFARVEPFRPGERVSPSK